MMQFHQNIEAGNGRGCKRIQYRVFRALDITNHKRITAIVPIEFLCSELALYVDAVGNTIFPDASSAKFLGAWDRVIGHDLPIRVGKRHPCCVVAIRTTDIQQQLIPAT